MGCRYHGLGNMKSRGYFRSCLCSVCHCLLRLFGETLSFETPASTQATICPLQEWCVRLGVGGKQGLPEWLPQEDLSYVTSLVVVASSKFMDPFFRRMMEETFQNDTRLL
jgi:hypothetical protein